MLVEKENSVAVWIGDLTEEELAEYITEESPDRDDPLNPFAADMGEYWYDSDMLGGNHLAKPVAIAKLIRPLAYSKSYGDAVVSAATNLGIEIANCVVALYRQELQVDQWPAASPLRFVGNFEFERK